MDIRAKQGGSAIVYGIISVLLAIGVIGAVYAVQKRASGEQIGPMEIAAQLNPTKDTDTANNSSDTSSDSKQAASEQSSNEEAEKQKAAEEQARKEQQAAEEEKAQQQRREAAATEAREREAEEKRAAEQKAAEQQKRESAEKPAAGAAPQQQMPSTGGPSALPQTGPADLVFGAFVLLVLGYSIIKFSFSQAYVNGR